jgi:Flp pilus assembly protein protease CpaA
MIQYIICVLFLTYFSYCDIKKGEVSNESILLFALVGLFLAQSIILGLIMVLFMFFVGYLLWHEKIFGGADTKVLSFIPLYIEIFRSTNFSYIQSIFLDVLLLLTLIGIIGIAYALILKKITNKNKIPFIPAIAISYIAFIVIKKIII